MLLFKTIKLPFHIRLKKASLKKSTGSINLHSKKHGRTGGSLKNIIIVVLLGTVVVLSRNIKTEDAESDYKNIFSIEEGTYIKKGILDEKNIEKNLVPVDLKMDGTAEILIFHTHSSEKYSADSDGNVYSVVNAGEKLAEILSEKYNIGVVHDVSEYDISDGEIKTDGSYERSRKGMESLLQKYPDIKILIDIHRDSFNGEEINTVSTSNGEGAYLMLVNGMCALDDNGKEKSAGVENPYIEQNIAYSYSLKNKIDDINPNIMKNIYLKPYRYSLSMKPCSFLLEVGNEKNTFAEAQNSLYDFAQALIESVR